MEFSLHRQLKQWYCVGAARQEVRIGNYRIDVVDENQQLVEIQLGSLAAIRDKTTALLADHCVRIVKPIIIRKRIAKRPRRGARVRSYRWSPKRGRPTDLFDELVYFTRVFPHPRLELDVPLVTIEEERYPGHGRRRRRRARDYVIVDQRILDVGPVWHLKTAADLWNLLPDDLPTPFHTAHLAEHLGICRWTAQRIAYCLRETGASQQVGKQRNTLLYKAA